MKRELILLIVFLFAFISLNFAQLATESFEGAWPPPGWTNSGFTRTMHPYNGTYAATGTQVGQYLVSPLMATPGISIYWHCKATGNIRFALETAPSVNGPWTRLAEYPIFAGNGWTEQTANFSGLTNVYIRWIQTQNNNNWYLDDISISAALPVTQASNLSFSNVQAYLATINWTPGSGTYSVVFLSEANAGTPGNPFDGTTYIPSTDWNIKGTQLDATGYYCVYNGTGSSETISNLLANTDYYGIVYTYNGSGVTAVYLTGGATGTTTTLDDLLPVELTSFTAVYTANLFVQLNWVTASETNHMGYYVLRNESDDIANAQALNISEPINTGNVTGSQITYNYRDDQLTADQTYYYWLQSVDLNGQSQFFGPISVSVASGQDPENPPIITGMFTALFSAYPNPFNASVPSTIPYYLKDAASVKIEVYNVKGNVVNSFSASYKAEGYHTWTWNGKDMHGKPVSSGIYYYRMNSGKFTACKKIILLK